MAACAYRNGDTNGPMYDSTGKKCDTISKTNKILLIAGCSAAGAALLGLAIYYLIRRARIRSRRNSEVDSVPARPLSAWAGRPGSTMATPSGGYDTDGVDYQKYAARSRASSYMKQQEGQYSPVVGMHNEEAYGAANPVFFQPQGRGYPQQQQGNYQQGGYDPEVSPTMDNNNAGINNNNRRSYYDANPVPTSGPGPAPRGLPVPPQAMASPSRRYSQNQFQTPQEAYTYNQLDSRGRSPSPSGGRAASPSAYYSKRQSGGYEYEYDLGGNGQGQGVYAGEEAYGYGNGRERVEMLSPEVGYIQPGGR